MNTLNEGKKEGEDMNLIIVAYAGVVIVLFLIAYKVMG